MHRQYDIVTHCGLQFEKSLVVRTDVVILTARRRSAEITDKIETRTCNINAVIVSVCKIKLQAYSHIVILVSNRTSATERALVLAVSRSIKNQNTIQLSLQLHVPAAHSGGPPYRGQG